ncbi:hypothetical protein Golob_009492 [Gossypium lobatum]|uniref:Uncharacterized protein n=1 Tax=Gossypium lobatum TaxID=34289 RepID=A0A7J8MIM8_9ROSI|nr:hypothetical protein [Gossypium lobatum]
MLTLRLSRMRNLGSILI